MRLNCFLSGIYIRKSAGFRLLHFDTSRSSTYPIYPNMHGKLTPNVSVHKNRTWVNSDLTVGYLKKCRSSEVSSFSAYYAIFRRTPAPVCLILILFFTAFYAVGEVRLEIRLTSQSDDDFMRLLLSHRDTLGQSRFH